MQARRASRELAFILFSQFGKTIDENTKESIDDMMIKSVRILMSSAADDIKISLGTLIDMKNKIDDYEAEHEINLSRPMGAKNISVPMPSTAEVRTQIDEMMAVAEKALLGLEIAEFSTLDSQQEVKEYTSKIVQNFQKNKDEVDKNIEKYAKGWDFDRLVKMDKDILRIAITELLFIKEVPMKVVVDEAVELAKNIQQMTVHHL